MNPTNSQSQGSYQIKKGDTLSGISKELGVPVEELLKYNTGVTNPNVIGVGQILKYPQRKTPTQEAQQKTISTPQSFVYHSIKSGENLSTIAKQNGISLPELLRNNPEIKDANMIRPGQKIRLGVANNPTQFTREPQKKYQYLMPPEDSLAASASTTEAVKPTIPKQLEFKKGLPIDRVYQEAQRINSLPQAQRVQEYMALYSPETQYLLLDKQQARLKINQGDKTNKEYEVLIGKKKGDEQTVTTYDYDREKSNFNTGSGIYRTTNKYRDSQYGKGVPSFNLANKYGEVPTALHATPNYRKKYFGNQNTEDNRQSWGCANMQDCDLRDMYDNQNIERDTPVFIIPEKQGNFEIRGNELYHTTQKEYSQDAPKLNRGKYAGQTGRKLQFSVVNQSPEFENTRRIGEALPADNENISGFVESLSKNEENLRNELGLSQSQYALLAKSAFGIAGAESKFGKNRGVFSPTTTAKYIAEDLYAQYPEQLGPLVSKVYHAPTSFGITQINPSMFDEEHKKIYDRYVSGIGELSNPQKSAIATMIMLAQKYKNEVPSQYKSDYHYVNHVLPILWHGGNSRKDITNEKEIQKMRDGTYQEGYVNSAKRYGNLLDIYFE